MKRKLVAAAAAALALSSAASAATFEVPMSGTYEASIFDPLFGGCPGAECEVAADLDGTFMTVTVPSTTEGTYTTGVEVSYQFYSPGALPVSPSDGLFGFDLTPADMDVGAQFGATITNGKLTGLLVSGGIDDSLFSFINLGFGTFHWEAGGGHSSATADGTFVLSSVPEPSFPALLGAGVLALLAMRTSRPSPSRRALAAAPR